MSEQQVAPEPAVEHDEERTRYVLRVGPERVGELVYRRDGDRIVMHHTLVDQHRRERGLGSTLVQAALDDVRRHGLRVVPQCPFVRAYVTRHGEYADLVADAG